MNYNLVDPFASVYAKETTVGEPNTHVKELKMDKLITDSCSYDLARTNRTEYDKIEYKVPFFKYEIKRIIINDGAVVVIFKDTKKVVVKRMAGDNDDIYSAVAQAVMKKMYGGTARFHKVVDLHTVKQEKKEKKE